MRKKIFKLFIAIIILSLLFTITLISLPIVNRLLDDSTKTLVWGGPKNISMLPIIAENKGFFKEVGLDVKSNYVQTGKIAMDAIISGDLDFGIIVDTNIAFIEFQKGANINVIASILEKYDDAIVARRDMGINTPKDLEGKTIAVLNGTTSQRFADLFIQYHKLDRSKITFFNLSPPSIQAAIINGEIPAGSIWQPYRYNVQKELKQNTIQFNDKQIYKAYSLLAVKREFAEKNSDKIQGFLSALIKAEEYIKDNKDDSISILAMELNIEPEVLAAVWEDYIVRVRLEMSLVKLFQEEGKWIKDTQKGFEQKEVPSYENILNQTLLEKINSSRVISIQ